MEIDLNFKDRFYLIKFLDCLLDDNSSFVYFAQNDDMLNAMKKLRNELFKD